MCKSWESVLLINRSIFIIEEVFLCILQVEGSALDPDLPEPLDCGQSNSDGAVLLQLREFKTHLLEAVEELHIWRVELNRITVQGHIPENAVMSF